ncbi:MAG: response regulator [Chitinispirillaceae bacterium]|nr:response regulator [Chitinispirillaceae bacterium]
MNNGILIIEPDPFDRDVFSKIFADSYEMKIMADSRGIEDIYRDFRPQVVLIDMRRTDINELRDVITLKNSYDEKVPVIVIVTDTTPDIEISVRQLGIFYYMVKPYDLRKLSDVLQGAFGIKKPLSDK